ncbi:hypothetical protein BHE74_00005727 [Ensete ventricosum]|nr:hypothetical protein BHE74_00005727 [Ensete ventricosum]
MLIRPKQAAINRRRRRTRATADKILDPVAVIAFFPAHPRANRTLPTDDDARLCGGRGASYRLRHSFYPRRVLVDSSSAEARRRQAIKLMRSAAPSQHQEEEVDIPLTEEKQRFHDHGYSLLRASWGTLLVDGWPAPAASECTGSPPAPPRAASGAGTPGSASRRWPRRSRTPDPSSLRSLRTRGCSLRPLFDVAEAPAVDHQRASVRCTTLHKRKRKRKRKSNLQHFANVACAKHLVDHDKLVGFIGREEGSKDAVLGASPPEKLARSTRRVATHFTGQQKKKTGYILADMEFGTVRLDGDASTYLSLKPKVIDDLNTRRKQ